MLPKISLLVLLLLAASSNAAASAAASIAVSPKTLPKSNRTVRIKWWGVPSPSDLDYVAIYSPASSSNRDFIGYIFLNTSSTWQSGYGEVSVPLVNLRSDYQFRIFRWPRNEYSFHHVDHEGDPLPKGRHRLAASETVGFAGGGAAPEQIHLAFADGVDEMRVVFVCGDGGERFVRYGLEAGKLGTEEKTEVRRYEQKDMCDYPANSSGWRDPGFVHDGLMRNLEPGRKYFYKVGSDSGGWSETYSFMSRDIDANETIAFLFGDLGTYAPYHAYFHTQKESKSTVKWILRDLRALGDKPTFVSHIGDISYAMGQAVLWDLFFDQIEPIASRVPYHVCIGNHEYDWPSQPWKPWWSSGIYGGKDSGGECGVPYSVKFRMPGSSSLPTGTGAPDTRNLYYSFDAGVVHFVYMSTETNFVQGSDQYNFIKADLESVNRSRTPFIVFQGHRPMYTTSHEVRDTATRAQMMQHLEPLLVQNKVTLALWGHVHTYERFCPIKNFLCVNTSSSFIYSGPPVHVVIGMAGQDYQSSWEPRPDHPDIPIFPQPERSMYRGVEFGYTKLVATREKLTLMYIGNHDGQVHDLVEIFSGQVSSNTNSSSVAKVVDDKVAAVICKRKFSWWYVAIGGAVTLALLLGFVAGFLGWRRKESAQWAPVKNEES